MNPIKELANKLRQVMIDESSIEDDKVSLWNAENFGVLWDALNKNLKEDKRGFIVKLAEQIQQAPHYTDVEDGSESHKIIVRLACELLGVYYAYPSNVSPRRKKKTLDELLGADHPILKSAGLSKDDFPIVVSAFNHKGIGSGGMGFNTNRQKEIFFLVEFFYDWFSKSIEERSSLLEVENRNSFQNVVDQLTGSRSPQARHLLLYYIHSDYYPPIISSGHKRNIVSVFSEFISEDALQDEFSSEEPIWAIDQKVRVISERLSVLRDKPTNFYSADLEPFWNSKAQAGMPDLDSELLEYKKQVVLYGPPGTGKTHTAKQLSEEIIRYRLSKTLGVKIFETEGQATLEKALSENIHRLQLHPAYSYEDFIRGLQIKNGDTQYVDGYLLQLLTKMDDVPHVLILDEINRVDLSRLFGECFSALENRGEVIDLPGVENGQLTKLCIPENLYIIGTMNLIDHSVEHLDFALRRRFLWVEANYNSEALMGICCHRWNQLDWNGCKSFSWDDVEQDFFRLLEAAEQLNQAIAKEDELGRDFMLGHVFFVDVVAFLRQFLDARSNRLSHYLFGKSGKPKEAIERLWRLSLKPLLKEYLAGVEKSRQDEILTKLNSAFRPQS